MRISMLEAREPFSAILEETLAPFLAERRGEPCAVRWRERVGLPRASRVDGSMLLCNRWLNAIFAPGAPRSVLEPVLREYTRSPRAWVRPAQRLYVRLATSRATARWLAGATVEIDPPLADARGLLVMGGNSRIRVLEPAAGRSWILPKARFPAAPLRREVEGRRRAASAGVPVPAILEAPAHGRWVLEEYTPGTPLNRLRSADSASRALRDVAGPLGRLHAATGRPADAATYAASLAAESARVLDGLRWLDPGAAAALRRAAGAAASVADDPEAGPFRLAFSHGDCHPGNVLVTERGPVLIDWEHSGERQAGHDALVLALDARSPRGLADRVGAYVGGGHDAARGAPGLEPPAGPEPVRRRAARLLLLETLVHYLREHEPAPIGRAGPGLLALVAELEPWLAAAGVAREREGARAPL